MDRQAWKKPAGGHLTGSDIQPNKSYHECRSDFKWF